MSASTYDVDVVIVGAGLSGLSAGRLLSNHGLAVRVLEARDRVGGRIYTARDPSFMYADLGAAYVGPTQRSVGRLAGELGLDFYKVFDQPARTVLVSEGSRYCYAGTVPTIRHPVKLLDVDRMMKTIDSLAKQVPPDAPWQAPKAAEWDLMTAKQFIDSICWTRFGRQMAEAACNVLAASSHELSLLSFLWYVRSGQGLDRLLNVTSGAQERKIVGGSGLLCQRIHDELQDKVKLSSPVVLIDQSSGDSVQISTLHGDVISCRYVIYAAPPAVLNRITFLPGLPANKVQAITRAPLGSGIKTVLYYKEAYWRQRNFSGQSISDVGPVGYSLDDTKPDGTYPALIGFIAIDKEAMFSGLSRGERMKVIAEQYAATFKCPELVHPVDYVDKDWSEEEYSAGGCVTFYPPGALTRLKSLEAFRQPFLRTYFAGTETATRWAGYMDGAVQSGERAAREILCCEKIISKQEVWVEEKPLNSFPE